MLAVALATALALAGGACGGDDDDESDAANPETTETTEASDSSSTDSTAEEGGEGTLVVSDFTFSEVTGAPGATVQVRNDDAAPHTVTADDDAFDSGEVAGGGTGEFTAPSEPGSYPIHCEIHSSMSGTVTVS